jgi:dynein heavy chain 2
MKELSPPNVNLKKLFQRETTSSEPVLIIISPGADPSQELEDLARDTIGSEKYHAVG